MNLSEYQEGYLTNKNRNKFLDDFLNWYNGIRMVTKNIMRIARSVRNYDLIYFVLHDHVFGTDYLDRAEGTITIDDVVKSNLTHIQQALNTDEYKLPEEFIDALKITFHHNKVISDAWYQDTENQYIIQNYFDDLYSDIDRTGIIFSIIPFEITSIYKIYNLNEMLNASSLIFSVDGRQNVLRPLVKRLEEDEVLLRKRNVNNISKGLPQYHYEVNPHHDIVQLTREYLNQ